MMFNSERKGVLPGLKVVRIRSSGGLGEEDFAPLEGERTAMGETELVQVCYNADPRLTVAVVGRSQRVDFELHSSGPP